MKGHSCLVDGFGHGAPGALRVEVSVLPGGLELRGPDGRRESLPYGDLEAERGGADGSVWILRSRARGLTVYVDSSSLKEALIRGSGEAAERFRALEKRQRRFVRSLDALTYSWILLPVLVVALLIWLFPVMLDKAVASIPAEWEKELGAAAASSALSGVEQVSHPDIDRLISEIALRFEEAGGPKLDIKVAKNPQVNAFALPGGQVVVNLGLITEAESASEVAGVLAHEAQHVALRHGLRGVVRSLGVSAVFALFSGSLPAGSQVAEKLFSLRFDRGQETEADLHALDLLEAARIDSRGMQRFFERLAREEGSTGAALAFLGTHPASVDRLEALADASRGRDARVSPFRSDFEVARRVAGEMLAGSR